MPPTRKDFAEFFRLGLLAGVCELSTVVRWADTIIISEASPPFAFLDLSTCENRPVSAAISFLKEIPGQTSVDLPVQMLLGHCYSLTRSGALAVPDTLVRLYRMATSEHFPQQIYLDLLMLEHNFSLASDGVYGAVADVAQKFIEFLRRFELYAPETPSGNV